MWTWFFAGWVVSNACWFYALRLGWIEWHGPPE